MNCVISIPKPQAAVYDGAEIMRLEFMYAGQTVSKKLYSVVSLASTEAELINALDRTGLNHKIIHSQSAQKVPVVKKQGKKSDIIDFAADIITYDEDQNETGRRRPTEDEVVIGTFAGHAAFAFNGEAL